MEKNEMDQKAVELEESKPVTVTIDADAPPSYQATNQG